MVSRSTRPAGRVRGAYHPAAWPVQIAGPQPGRRPITVNGEQFIESAEGPRGRIVAVAALREAAPLFVGATVNASHESRGPVGRVTWAAWDAKGWRIVGAIAPFPFWRPLLEAATFSGQLATWGLSIRSLERRATIAGRGATLQFVKILSLDLEQAPGLAGRFLLGDLK